MADIDIKDTPYVALALSFDNDGIWSEDKGFFKQDKIKVWNTQEIIKSLG
jgi:predicted nucleic acid-binding protein